MKYKCLEKIKPNAIKKGKVLKFINKCLMAVLLGVISLIVMEYSPKFKTFMNEEVLGKNISFGFIGKIYNKYFGEVLPTTEDKVVEVFYEKLAYSKIEKYMDGEKLTVSNNYLVPVIDSGIIVFIGEKEGFGKIITVEQEDKATITYGNIKNTDLKLYDYVTKGKFLGEIDGDILYLIINKDNNNIGYETYISG